MQDEGPEEDVHYLSAKVTSEEDALRVHDECMNVVHQYHYSRAVRLEGMHSDTVFRVCGVCCVGWCPP